jgi:hypothetical protein
MDPNKLNPRDESPLTQAREYDYPSEVQLWFKFGTEGDWVLTLSILFEEIGDYPLPLLRWLCYLLWCQGVLNTGPDSPEVDDYCQ